MSSAAPSHSSGASATAEGTAMKAAPRRKRVRKQKTEADLDAAAQVKEEAETAASTAAVSSETQPRKKTKREPAASSTSSAAAAVAPPQPTFSIDTRGDIDEAMPAADDDEAPAEESKEGEEEAASSANSGYLSQETLNYYKQLALVLDKDEFENEDEKSLFLANVISELCSTDGSAGKLSTSKAANSHESTPGFILQRLCSHAKCSHLVQKIMEIANAEQVAMFLTALQDNVVAVLSDRYGSHVLESVLFRLPSLLQAEASAQIDAELAANTSEYKDSKQAAASIQSKIASKQKEAFKNIGTFSASSLTNSLSSDDLPLRTHFYSLITKIIVEWFDITKDVHGAFIMRHIVHLLGGEQNIKAAADSDSKGAAAAAAALSTSLTPIYLAGLEELLPWFVQEILNSEVDTLDELTRNSSSVPVFQSLFRMLSKSRNGTKAAIEIARKILRWKEDDTKENLNQAKKNAVSLLLTDRSGSRLFESICSLHDVTSITAVWNLHMHDTLLDLSKHQIGNFSVQHVLQCVRRDWSSEGRHIVRSAYEVLTSQIKELCAASRTGVVLQLCDACIRMEVKEKKLLKQLLDLAQSAIEGDLTPITSNMIGALLLTPLLKSATQSAESISVIGSLIVQSYLQPAKGLQAKQVTEAEEEEDADKKKQKKKVAEVMVEPFASVFNSFLTLPQEFILQLALDSTGSHVFDAFVSAPAKENIKQQLLRKFQMKWVELSMSPSGSYVLEKLFALAPNQLKVGIAGDLCRAEKRVMSSRSGAMVWRKLRLDHFKKHQQSWLTSNEAARTRAVAMFADVFSDGAAPASSSSSSSSSNKKDATSKKTDKKSDAAKSSDKKKAPKEPKVKDERKEESKEAMDEEA